MPQSKHKYRVSIYLGKEIYENLSDMANVIGISLSTMAKLILTTGYELSKKLDNDFSKKGGKSNGD